MTPILAQRALQVALGELARGVHETPAGSNSGPSVDRYILSRGAEPPQKWCAAFVAWCITEASQQLLLPSPLAGWGDLMSAYKWEAAAKAKGRWRAEPYPGMVGVILQPDQHHVILVRDFGCEWVQSVEGNWEDKVAEVERHVTRFAGFVDWYTPEDAAHAAS